jgi:putative ABC transport system permease protein
VNGPQLISLSPWDLALAAGLVVALAAMAFQQGLALHRPLLTAALRTALQLALIGLVLEALFLHVHPLWVGLMALVMLLAAGHEVRARQRRRLRGWWGFGTGTLSMFLSAFTVTALALTLLIEARPWYAPQYAIPLLGMLLGNTMTGVALALDRVTQGAWERRAEIEGRLMLGADWREATAPLRREAARSGLMPIINAMAAAGLVSLPGMMTGQILAGAPPLEAVKYQILIMFLIAGGTGFGTFSAVWLGSRRLFDERQRLRLDRLQPGN